MLYPPELRARAFNGSTAFRYTRAMSLLSLFGAAAVSAMLLFYALEERAPVFVLLFAGACAASSAYGFLQGAWPFGIVEAIWTVVAVRRWRQRMSTQPQTSARSIACDMSALSAAERERYDGLRRKMTAAITHAASMRTEFRLRLDGSIATSEAAEWMALEHRCCPFLNLRMGLDGDGTRWIEIGGSEAIKAFVAGEFGSFART